MRLEMGHGSADIGRLKRHVMDASSRFFRNPSRKLPSAVGEMIPSRAIAQREDRQKTSPRDVRPDAGHGLVISRKSAPPLLVLTAMET